MRTYQRKTAPQVVQGEVRKKNRWTASENRYDAPRPREVVVDRERPGEGYRHVLTKKDVYDFLGLLPDWDKLAVGLNAVVLSPGSQRRFGYHVPGVVHVCAWDAPLWFTASAWLYNRDKAILARLGVECELLDVYIARQIEDGIAAEEAETVFARRGRDTVLCKFTEGQARAFQLLDVLLHELGHHHDRMTTRSQRDIGRGEKYAEEYARKHEALIWEKYVRTFPLF